MFTSSSNTLFFFICLRWISRIYFRPSSFGSLISIWTYSLPDLKRAGSIKSFLFVIPITRIFLGESTPSIRVSSWFTNESPMLDSLPLRRAIESISSKIMTNNLLFSPFVFHYLFGYSKTYLSFFYPSPTNLSIISGPFTIIGSISKFLDSYFARRVFPVPGGP